MFLQLNQPFSFSLDDSSKQTSNYFFLREVLESEVIEKALLAIHFAVLPHLVILINKLIEQFANAVLRMQFAVLLQKSIFRRSGFFLGHYDLPQQRVVITIMREMM